MQAALEIAARGLYTTDPNPRVGCVLVRNDEVVGQGYHVFAGQGHAEVNAIAAAGDNSRGSTAYVTLEPCSFEGRTPACVNALVDAGIIKVVAAMADPDPRNAGQGFQKLRDAGIEVIAPFMESSARDLNPGHVSKHESGRPYVRLKLAMTLDGKTALANGKSQWITGEAARRDVQALRARSSAIVTGVQTVIDDDPRMTVRAESLDAPDADSAAARRRPVYILDSRGRVPRDAQLMGREDVVLVSTRDVDTTVENLVINEDDQGRVDLQQLMSVLAGRDTNEVLFECGATLAGSLVSQRLCDEVVIYAAPRFIGNTGRSLLNLPEIDNMGDLVDMKITDVQSVDRDLRITLIPDGLRL